MSTETGISDDESVDYKFTSSESLKHWHEVAIAACKSLPDANIGPKGSLVSVGDQTIVEFGTDGGDKAKFRVTYQKKDKEIGQKVVKALESAFHAQPYES